jgi:DNA-binding beta-propeller fold protein YncE
MPRTVRRFAVIALASAVLALCSLTAIVPGYATTAADISSLAVANLGKGAGSCSTANNSANSLGGSQFESSCTGYHGSPEYWCADFVNWVWQNANGGSINVSGLNASAGSFYLYGSDHGTLHTSASYQPQAGDAIVYDYDGAGGADHVGLIISVNSDGTIETLNGDWGGVLGQGERKFAETSTVESMTLPASEIAIGSTPSSIGMTISAYVTPAESPPGASGSGPGGPSPATAYVVSNGDGTVTPINLATGTPGTPIHVGNKPTTIAITLDGKTAYVTNSSDGTVTPINLATGTPGTPIHVGNKPTAIAITPDGATAYVVNNDDGTVTPINLATGTPGTPITVGNTPTAIAITPDGKTAYVTDNSGDTVTPINLATGTPGTPIHVGNGPSSIAIAPDGRTAYVTGNDDGTVTPISLPADSPGTPITVGNPTMPFVGSAYAIAIAPDGRTAYVLNNADEPAHNFLGTVTPINLATGTLGTPITVGHTPYVIAITPDGRTAYVSNGDDGTITPINLPTGIPGTPIHVGNTPDGIAIIP